MIQRYNEKQDTIPTCANSSFLSSTSFSCKFVLNSRTPQLISKPTPPYHTHDIVASLLEKYLGKPQRRDHSCQTQPRFRWQSRSPSARREVRRISIQQEIRHQSHKYKHVPRRSLEVKPHSPLGQEQVRIHQRRQPPYIDRVRQRRAFAGNR